MERLTFFENGHWCIRLNGVVYGDFPEVDRLAAYEDTGLEPEEIKELCSDDVAKVAKMFRHIIEDGSIDRLEELLQAEHDGRLVVKPSTPAYLTREEVKAALAKANPTWCDHIKRRFEKVT